MQTGDLPESLKPRIPKIEVQFISSYKEVSNEEGKQPQQSHKASSQLKMQILSDGKADR